MILHADKVGLPLGSKFHIWDRVLCRLTGKYHSSAKCLASLIRELIFFQIYTGSLAFGFKLIIFFFQKSMRILFTDRVLLTIKHMDKILGKFSLVPYSPKITVAYGELHIYFTVQIPPFIDWT